MAGHFVENAALRIAQDAPQPRLSARRSAETAEQHLERSAASAGSEGSAVQYRYHACDQDSGRRLAGVKGHRNQGA